MRNRLVVANETNDCGRSHVEAVLSPNVSPRVIGNLVCACLEGNAECRHIRRILMRSARYSAHLRPPGPSIDSILRRILVAARTSTATGCALATTPVCSLEGGR